MHCSQHRQCLIAVRPNFAQVHAVERTKGLARELGCRAGQLGAYGGLVVDPLYGLRRRVGHEAANDCCQRALRRGEGGGRALVGGGANGCQPLRGELGEVRVLDGAQEVGIGGQLDQRAEVAERVALGHFRRFAVAAVAVAVAVAAVVVASGSLRPEGCCGGSRKII
jgi:hypothetical protein